MICPDLIQVMSSCQKAGTEICAFFGEPIERMNVMENAPKIAVLVVLALVVGSIFIATSKEYSKNVSDKTVEQTNNLFNSTGAGS